MMACGLLADRVDCVELETGAVNTLIDEPVADLSAGLDFMCAATQAGSVHCWGDNEHGQLGGLSAMTIEDRRVEFAE